MNKITQLAEAYAIARKNWGDGDVKLGAVSDAYDALQTEVTRMEAELAAANANASKFAALHEAAATLCEKVTRERDALRAKLAALEE